MEEQEKVLESAGAKVFLSSDGAARFTGRLLRKLNSGPDSGELISHQVDVGTLTGEFGAINVGLESFSVSLQAQGASVFQVEWKPAAGGNADLMSLLEKMKG